MAKGKTALPASGLQSGLVNDQVLEIVSTPATGGLAAKGTLGSVLEIASTPAQSTAGAAARNSGGGFGVVNLPGSGGSLPSTIKVATNTVNGTSGNDILSPTTANDVLNGLEGDDLITGSDGDDTAFGGTGRDRIFAGSQLDTLFGGDGNDSLGTGNGRDTLYGGTGNDTLYQISGSTHLLEGSVGDDVATFFNFNDPYTSQDFEFSGGAGRDTLLLEAQARVGGFSYNLTGATDAAVVGADNHKIIFFSQTEVFHFLGGGSNDTVSFLYNGALDAILEGNTGSDTFYAGDGAGANPGGANGVNVTAFGGEGNDTLLASGGADSMVGGVGNDSFNGAAGDDVYFTNYDLGSDSVVGGAGLADLLVAQGSKALASSWTVNATATGFDAVLNGGANGRVRADGVELLYMSGSNQAETFTMSGNFATGGLTSVTIDMSNGSDVYNGNAASNANFLVDIHGGLGADSIYDSSGSERVIAGSGDDVFVQSLGGAAGDTFIGNSGNDFVQMIEPAGGPGATAMLVYGDNGEDAEGLGLDQISYVTENRNGTSHYVFNKEFLSNDGFTMLQYFAVETFELHGSQSAVDILQVDSQGTVTSLRFFGNGGNDTLFVNPLGGTDNTHITGFGGVGNDSLFGGSTSDILDGGDGRDTLMGGFGGDTLQGGSNTLVGGVTFGDSLYGDEGNDLIFYDSADDLIVGGTGHDTLIGTSGQDLIQMTQAKYHAGGSFASFEVVSLGSGNDYYLGPDTPGDFARITGGVTLFGGSGADQLSMRGNNFALGNNDSVYGGVGDDVIWGGGGNDTLSGDGGHDNMYGGYGNDTMTGGAGFDVTYVGRNEGSDRILDSEGLVLFWGNEPQGAAPLYNGVDPTEISIQYSGGEVIISMLDESNNVTNTVRFAAGSVQTINLFDFANGDAGNGATPPPLGQRDIYSASWNGTTFNAFTKVVDG